MSVEFAGETEFEVTEVFTPTKPARVAFVEREDVNDRLVSALTTPGKQIVVYGHSGMGKTTLLVNKLHQLYEHHITTRCMKGMKFEQLMLDAFDQLEPFYSAETSRVAKQSAGLDLGASYKLIKAKLAVQQSSEIGEKQVRFLPPQLTAQALARLLGAQRACWVIEDFHKIDAGEKESLAQLMKVFMDMSDEYSKLKIIAIGAVDTARQVVDYDPEMRNRISEINVPLMDEQERSKIIEKGEAALNVRFEGSVKRQIVRHSNGLPSVCHHLCLNMCQSAGVTSTMSGETVMLTSAHFERALKNYIAEASDSIKSAFSKALKPKRNEKYKNAELIIEALSSLGENGAARLEIFRKIRDKEAGYQDANLKKVLPKLVLIENGAIIRFDSSTGLYSFSDPIYRAYALANYKKHSSGYGSAFESGFDADDVNKILIRFFNELTGKKVVVKAQVGPATAEVR
ncbi:ATP-binding protein [Stenotrophomonas rhizophila]|uniref:ATP-binding protein n=1 Tax=Stenotrophomonas rhizophila TaxID=216778 RepID=UPI0028AF41AF|nr:ATP-binding protein [Stenotrophomonas rhizophila]